MVLLFSQYARIYEKWRKQQLNYLGSLFLRRPDRRPVHPVDPVVQAARVAQMVARSVPAPQRRHIRRAIHALLDVRVQNGACGKVRKQLHDYIIMISITRYHV